MRRKGFTLIEVAISIALLGIVVLWSINVVSNISRGSNATEEIETATLLSSQKAEELKLLNLSGIQSLSASNGTFASPYDNYSWQITNVSSDENSNAYIKRITINVFKTGNPNPLMSVDVNFIRGKTDGKDIGI